MTLQIVNWFDDLLNHFWSIRDFILKEEAENTPHIGDYFGFYFGYPDYSGFDKEIGDALTEKQWRLIQVHVGRIMEESSTKEEFCQKMCDLLSNGLIKVIN